MTTKSGDFGGFTRRDFLETSAIAALGISASVTVSERVASSAELETLKVGVIGCGARGTGAARDVVASSPGIEIAVMGDLFQDRIENSYSLLQQNLGERVNVGDDQRFVGFDAYKRVVESDVDIVILASPPGFRPIHFQAAVAAGKHVFMEKPVCVDIAGAYSVIETSHLADRYGLSVVTGTQLRRQNSCVEAVRRIHDGIIGDLVGGQASYLAGPVWLRDRKVGMSDMEWQCRNWYYFTWLSGDHIVEQFIHNLDLMNWIFDSHPEKALGMGGRISRIGPSYGHIYDHFSIGYEYPGGVHVEAKCRQMTNSALRQATRVVGTKGVADLTFDGSLIRTHRGEVLFEYSGRGNDAYRQEQIDLIASIRDRAPINEARQTVESTLTAVMGRESAYTGMELTWEDTLSANLDLVPKSLSFGPMPRQSVPRPGITKLNRAVE